jgi:predicted signal transduction protein with EAL and GGDEF domain
MLRTTDIQTYRKMLQNARSPDEAVMMEQLRAISQNIPALYLLLTVAIAALGSTLLGSAPDWLTIWVPAAFFGFATIRLLAWRKMHQVLIDPDKARHQLKRVEIGTMLLFLGMAVWIWALLPYADPQERLHFSFFAAFTGASSTICGISRPRLVGVCLAMTLAVFCFLFFSMSERFFYLATAQIGITYFVFFMASLSYKSRLAQSVVLLNRLDAENRRSSELANTNHSMALTDMLTGLPNRRSFF